MNQIRPTLKFMLPASVAAMLLALVGCGGGGSDVSSVSGTIGGTGLKGPVSGAIVRAYAITNGQMGQLLGTSAATGTGGSFSVSIGNYTGPIMLQLSGGSYPDEATSATVSMSSNVMTAVLQNYTTGQNLTGIEITPLTSMAQMMAKYLSGGMTPANIQTANTGLGNYCRVSNILTVQPMDPTAPNSGNSAGQDQMDYGMCLAAMSQYATEQGLTTPSDIVTAMMNDASDGTMDGMMAGGGQVQMGMGMGGMMGMPSTAGTSGLATAMTDFINNTSVNLSGVTTSNPYMSALINQLNSSGGGNL
jgi:hypothetical protein